VNEVKDELKDTTYELFIGALSVLAIVNVGLFYFISMPDLKGIILVMNTALSLIFLADFFYRLLSAHSKSAYFLRQMGWGDLLASLPFLGFKVLCIFRILRVVRVRRAFGTRRILRNFLSNRSGSVLLSMLFLMILVLEFGGLAMLSVEGKSPSANIKNASDVLWYIFVTVTTIGYGDQYPVTNTGRIIGVVIMTVGVGLFGTLTAYLAKFFIKPEAGEADVPGQPSASSDEIRGQMQEIKQMLQASDQTNQELKARIEDLDDFIRKNTTKP
jgi:voltage-gated potassium channel Kch